MNNTNPEQAARMQCAVTALWNQANLVGQAIGLGRLDGTNAVAVAAAIRATTPEEFAVACATPPAPKPEPAPAVQVVRDRDGDMWVSEFGGAWNLVRGEITTAVLDSHHGPLTPVTLTEPTPAAAPKMWRDKNGDHWVKATDGSMHRSSPLGLEPSAIETLFGPLTPTTEATA